jgi:hypothetical protein
MALEDATAILPHPPATPSESTFQYLVEARGYGVAAGPSLMNVLAITTSTTSQRQCPQDFHNGHSTLVGMCYILVDNACYMGVH